MELKNVFGSKSDHSINQNVHTALLKHGFVNNDKILNPFKVDDNLYLDESINFETGKKLTELLVKAMSDEFENIYQ